MFSTFVSLLLHDTSAKLWACHLQQLIHLIMKDAHLLCLWEGWWQDKESRYLKFFHIRLMIIIFKVKREIDKLRILNLTSSAENVHCLNSFKLKMRIFP